MLSTRDSSNELGWVRCLLALALVPIMFGPAQQVDPSGSSKAAGTSPEPATISPRAATPAVSLADIDAPPAGLTREGWSQIRGAVDEASYHAIRVSPAATMVAPNRKQRYRTEYRSDGIEISSKPVAGKDWKVGVRLTGYGYEGDVRPLPVAEPRADKQRVEYRRGSVTEWYENRPAGLEQGFTLAEPSERRTDPLVLVLAVEGLGVSAEGQSAALTDESGQTVVRYGGLRAWDADGRALIARMEPADRGLQLVIDAPDARFPLTVDPTFVQEGKLVDNSEPEGAAGDRFGSVAVSGDTAVIGAYQDDVGANADQGSAYVFVRSAGIWSAQQKLAAADGAANDQFGISVAVSGDTAIIGAHQDDAGANADQGSAYVFVRTGGVWSQQQKLTASDGAAGDSLGYSVAVSGDTAVLGALGDTVGANAFQGSAYVFVRSGSVWSQQQKLVASDGVNNAVFGISVAVSGDTAVVGAYADAVGGNAYQGLAYVFVRTGSAWSQQQKLTAPDGASLDFFGISAAVSGDTAVIGAREADVGANADQGAAYVFARSGSVWSQQQKLTAADGAATDWFGYSVAVSGDTVLVGAPFDDGGATFDQGSAYVFVRSGAVWSQQQKLTAADGADADWFGFSVAVSGDTAIAGAPTDAVGANANQGSASVFARSAGVWSQQQKLLAMAGAASDNLGYSVAVSGDTAVVGAYHDDVGPNADQGSAVVFVKSGSIWSVQQKLIAPDGSTFDTFGFSVAVSGDTAIVGAVNANTGALGQGAAYVFVRTGTVWTQQQKLTAADGAGGDGFGGSVAASGGTVLVGAAGANSGAGVGQGAAYVFVRSGTVWTLQQKLKAQDGAASDQFGLAASLSGDTAVVGAPYDDAGAGSGQGSAYVFTRTGTAWSQQQKLTAADGASSDNFGNSVGVSGDTAVVGAPITDLGIAHGQGSAYVFVRNAGVWSQQQKLGASDTGFDDRFGVSVAVSGDTVVAGAWLDDVGVNANQGSAYVFMRSGGVWSQQQKLTASDGAADDRFGIAVAISGNVAVVGAHQDDVGPIADQGSAYVFRVPASTTILASSANPSVSGQSVTFTATVAPPGATGQVTFRDGATAVCSSVALVSGQATCATAALSVGTHSIAAEYTGDATFAASTSTPLSQVVNGPPTVVTPTSASITLSTATLGGNVTGNGGAPISGRGVVYAPTSTNNNPLIGGAGVIQVPTSGTTGVFTVGVTSLSPATGYSFKAYATNAAGTAYSPVSAFSTLALPTLSISDVTLTEGNTGVTHAVFTVTLSAASGQTVTVSALTSDLSANAGVDYTAAGPQILTFAPSVTTQTFSVPILGDIAIESDETLQATLSSPTNATILDGTGIGTITNDDGTPPSRTFVATEGNDLGVCSDQTSPCRNLTAAIAQVAIDGEVIVLTPGEYDATASSILIGKSLKITSPSGTVAFIRKPLVVNAPGGRVILRGLTLKGGGAGSGVTLVSANALSIEETTLDSWTIGLDLGTGPSGSAFVTSTSFTRNTTGVSLSGGTKMVAIEGARFFGNGNGLSIQGGSFTIRESAFIGGSSAGVSASGGTAEIQRSEFFMNAIGATTAGSGTVRIGRSHVFANGIGLLRSGGQLESRGSNVVRGNTTNISGTVTPIPEK